MRLRKIIGWILFVAGIFLVGWSLYSTYNVFTGKSSAPELFKIEERKDDFVLSSSGSGDFQEDIKKMVEKQIGNMVPTEFLSKLFNLISWSVLAGVLIFGGSRFCFIGVKLIKASE